MPGKTERAVRPREHAKSGPRVLDWEDARIFLEISRRKSFRAAAVALHQSVNALRRRLTHLERQLGVTLFTRHIDGVRLTAEGERVAAIAERMELHAFELVRATGRGDAPKGEVRVAITEGLGTFWVAPRLVNLHLANPDVLVDLQCAMTPADVLRLEADVAIQLVAPEQKDLRVVRLGKLHTMPFASRSYVEANGAPKTIPEIAKHQVVVQMADQVTPAHEFVRRFIGMEIERITLRTNVSSAHYWAIVNGAGIGMLPTYVTSLGDDIVPIDLPLRTQHDIWLVYHPDSGRIPRVRLLIDWLIDAFSASKYPWFADQFVHPSKLPKTPQGRAT